MSVIEAPATPAVPNAFKPDALNKPSRVLAIVNPTSGNQSGEQVAGWLGEIAATQGIELVIRETSPEQPDAKALVTDAKQFNRIVASGGDGTIMQVLNGIAQAGVPLAVVPAGTGNALAIALKLTLDHRLACEQALGDVTTMPLDLGLMDDKLYFALRLSIGYEAEVTKDTTRELKTVLGKGAYIFQAIRHAIGLRAVRYRFEMDGKTIRRRAENVWVANAGSLGIGDLDLDPNISFNDGQLDLCAMHFTFQRDLQVIVQRLLARQRLPATVLSRIPFRDRIRIITYPKQPIQVDGEVVGHTPCEVRVVPNAIRVCKPVTGL